MKKLIALLLAMVMVIGLLAGCSKKSDKNGNDNKKEDSSQSEEEKETTGENETEGTGDEKPVTGDLVLYGKKTTYSSGGFINNIETIRVDAAARTVTVTLGDEDGEVWTETKYVFDTSGNLLSETYVDFEDAEENYKYEYAYDAAGHTVRDAEYDATGNLVCERLSQYDAAGNEISYTYNDCEYPEDNERGELQYNANGDVIYGVCYDAEGDKYFETTYEYEYNAAGKMTRKVQRDGDGYLVTDSTYTYDDAGNLTGESYTYSNGDVAQGDQYTYTYDASGKVLSVTAFSCIGKRTSQTKYEYNAAGKIIQETVARYNEAENLQTETTTRYDDAGLMTLYHYQDHEHAHATRKIEYTYKAGQMSESKIYTHDGKIMLTIKFTEYQAVPFTVKDASLLTSLQYNY